MMKYVNVCLIVLVVGITLVTNNLLAQNKVSTVSNSNQEKVSQFSQIEQPLSLKITVALVGLGLIGGELWWFLFNKSK